MWEELIANTLEDVKFITVGIDTIIAWDEMNEIVHTWSKTQENIDILTKISKYMNFTMYN